MGGRTNSQGRLRWNEVEVRVTLCGVGNQAGPGPEGIPVTAP